MKTPPKLTRKQAAIIGAYTGVTCGPFDDIHEYAEKKLGRQIWTHQFGTGGVGDELKDAAKPDFMALCADRDDPK